MFQSIILQCYISKIDPVQLTTAWGKFREYFQDPQRQANILKTKEEEYQEGFLRELFVDVFGYILKPNQNFNLKREQKNELNAKSADGAVLKNGNVFAVIELKDTNTTDLESVEPQAFGYKNAHRGVRYVIIANFMKIRLYIDSTLDFREFNLFTLSYEEFKILYLCFAAESLLQDIPLRVREESLSKEQEITERLYADYSAFKRLLFEDICAKNSDHFPDRLLLFKKTQKLLDRMVFIFFCEDRGLLPANSIAKTIEAWKKASDWEPIPLYDRFKKFFEFINAGNPKLNIFAYNGGLFAPDDILDALVIDDELLETHSKKLSDYDFASEIDVNILGHIFEHSLTEIEEISGQIAAESDSRSKGDSRRKKDGIFYTPNYITNFIVESSLGRLCEEKKNALDINDENFPIGDYTATKKKSKQALLEKYRDWLLNLKICDPACGSGAFLVAALKFLIDEHKKIDVWTARVQYGKDWMKRQSVIEFSDIDQSILENNLYGVDINEESVEIARLSLWLHTCRQGRKLNNLSKNIQCGNSLLTEEFDWNAAFPFGGFDVVIGNPPYVQLCTLGEKSRRYAEAGFDVYDSSGDLYCLFTERGFKLLKEGGIQSFIMPNKWMIVEYGKKLRALMVKTELLQILNFGDVQFFQDATTNCCIFAVRKPCSGETSSDPSPTREVQVLSVHQGTYQGFESALNERYFRPTESFTADQWLIPPQKDQTILQRMTSAGTKLKDLPIKINRGILTGFNKAFFIDTPTRDALVQKDPRCAKILKPLLRGRDIASYGHQSEGLWLIGTFPSLKLNIDDYPIIRDYLLTFGKTRLEQTGGKGSRKKTCNQWFETQDSIAYYQDFFKPKILYPNMTKYMPFYYDEEGFVSNDKSFILNVTDESLSLYFLTGLFNSKWTKLWIWHNCPDLMGGTREIRKVYFENFPVPNADSDSAAALEDLAKVRIAAAQEKKKIFARFERRLADRFDDVKASPILKVLESGTFKKFLAELKKQKKKLSLAEQDEWEEYFTVAIENSQKLEEKIRQTDIAINAAVGRLYGFTEEEINAFERQEIL